MDALVRCENCRMPLRVPRNAGGHRARCAACGTYFQVPLEEVLLEETISSWIEHDVEEVFSERQRMIEQQLAATFNPGTAEADRRRQMEERALRRWRGEMRRPRGRAGSHIVLSDALEASPEAEPDEPAAHAMEPPDDDRADEHAWESEPPASDVHDPTPDAPPGMLPEAAPDEAANRYPQNLHDEGPTPRLVVEHCDHMGVRFLFDACWLDHEGFRASMPIRCAFSGSTDRRLLIARPIVFVDRERGQPMPLEKLNALHEHRELSDHAPRHVMRAMGKLEALPHPFNLPMPYYVSNRYAHLFIRCRTRDRSDGGVTCELLMGDIATALEWLARVNGVCGEEYQLLEQEVSLLHGEAWRTLSHDCRERISSWCKLRPRELFRLYLSDVDFGRRDEGLAGMVLTDQRMVFCKYHRRGEVPLDDRRAVITAHCDGRFAHLTLQIGTEQARMIKLHQTDLKALQQVLDHSGAITLSIKEQQRSTNAPDRPDKAERPI